jgi:hypothetical protein
MRWSRRGGRRGKINTSGIEGEKGEKGGLLLQMRWVWSSFFLVCFVCFLLVIERHWALLGFVFYFLFYFLHEGLEMLLFFFFFFFVILLLRFEACSHGLAIVSFSFFVSFFFFPFLSFFFFFSFFSEGHM